MSKLVPTKVDRMWEQANDNERFGFRFGMFPLWVKDVYDPTTQELAELMRKSEEA